MGSALGRNFATRHAEPACTRNPLYNAEIKPDRTSDDLPLPEVPTTDKNRDERSRRSSSSISFSRPKKRWSSSGSKGRKPGKGLNITADLQRRPSLPSARQSSDKRLQGVGREPIH